MFRYMVAFFIMSVSVGVYALPSIQVEIDKGQIDPLQNEVVNISLFAEKDGVALVSILSPDGVIVRLFEPVIINGLEATRIEWDGRNSKGEIIAEEAYFPRVIYKVNGQVAQDYYPLLQTGGEPIGSLPVSLNKDFSVSFRLNTPARVLVRAGVKNGPMLRSLSSWEVFPKGTSRLVWRTKDDPGLEIFNMPGFSLFATGYRLPASAIIVKNSDRSYRDSCINGDDIAEFHKSRHELRAPEMLSSRYFESKCLPGEPQIEVVADSSIINLLKVKATMPKEYADKVFQDLYEITLYIDNEFVMEREQGYMPFYFSKDTSGLSKGKHWLTVNVTGFLGHVGTATVPFEVK